MDTFLLPRYDAKNKYKHMYMKIKRYVNIVIFYCLMVLELLFPTLNLKPIIVFSVVILLMLFYIPFVYVVANTKLDKLFNLLDI